MNVAADELKVLGEKLQQAIVLTRMRLAGLPNSRVKARGNRALEHSDKMFAHVSQLVMAASGMKVFLEKAFGVSVADLFVASGHPKLAQGATYAGTAAIIELVKRTIDELAAVNAALDREVKDAAH